MLPVALSARAGVLHPGIDSGNSGAGGNGSGGPIDGIPSDSGSGQSEMHRWAEEEAVGILMRYTGMDSESQLSALGGLDGLLSLQRQWARLAMDHRIAVASESAKGGRILAGWSSGDILSQMQQGLPPLEHLQGTTSATSAISASYPALAAMAEGDLDNSESQSIPAAGLLEHLVSGCGATPQEVAGLLVPWGSGGACDLAAPEQDGGMGWPREQRNRSVVLGGYPSRSSMNDSSSSSSSSSRRGKGRGRGRGRGRGVVNGTEVNTEVDHALTDSSHRERDDSLRQEVARSEASTDTEISGPTESDSESDLSRSAEGATGTPLHYLCRCSKAGFLARLTALPAEELEDMLRGA